MSIKTLLCSFYKSSAAMQQKAVASVVILSGLACVCIRALLCEPVSAPGGHSPSLLPQGALLVDPGLLISPNNHSISSQSAACSISSHPAATLVRHGQTCPLLNIPPFSQSPDSGIGSHPFLGTRSFVYKSSCCPHWSRGPLHSEVTWLLLSLQRHQKLCYYLSSGDKHGQNIPASTQEPHQPKVFTDSDQCCQNRA